MSVDDSGATLLEKWNEGQELFAELENVPTKDPRFKEMLERALKAFQTCAVFVIEKSLFSENEELDEIATPSLKYLSIPFYLAELTQKIPTANPHERLPRLQQALNYYKKFLSDCTKFKVMKKKQIETYMREAPPDPETKRNEKIERYRLKNEIQSKLKALMKQKIEKGIFEEELAEDNELERDMSLLLLEQNAITALDNMGVLQEEINMLDQITQMMLQHGGQLPEIPKPAPMPPRPPIVLTDPRREVASKVFRPGWNLPTVSVEEANYIDAQEAMKRHQKEKEKEARQKYVEEWGDGDLEKEDENKVYKDREWDDWKDENPRGSGNTGTRGYKY